jgi:hypothetical protein
MTYKQPIIPDRSTPPILRYDAGPAVISSESIGIFFVKIQCAQGDRSSKTIAISYLRKDQEERNPAITIPRANSKTNVKTSQF